MPLAAFWSTAGRNRRRSLILLSWGIFFNFQMANPVLKGNVEGKRACPGCTELLRFSQHTEIHCVANHDESPSVLRRPTKHEMSFSRKLEIAQWSGVQMHGGYKLTDRSDVTIFRIFRTIFGPSISMWAFKKPGIPRRRVRDLRVPISWDTAGSFKRNLRGFVFYGAPQGDDEVLEMLQNKEHHYSEVTEIEFLKMTSWKDATTKSRPLGTSTTEGLNILGEECSRFTGGQIQSCIEGSGRRGRLRRNHGWWKEDQRYGPSGDDNVGNTLHLTVCDSVSGAQTPSDTMNGYMRRSMAKAFSYRQIREVEQNFGAKKDSGCDENVLKRNAGRLKSEIEQEGDAMQLGGKLRIKSLTDIEQGAPEISGSARPKI
ncbi:hypothetical protein IW261DRAFT_1417510 [Armillaria novae-zelandiae]|uniref:C2H2-type domain-containing protein n=1 Tax=Armillaria novae-zelandiae TaxID=153914 RepID=A0AA39UEB4_9AGAR|nr:hypothetical protein IW261DRAFT_1417510 [Armillaria novae-zelandiae]